MCPYWEKMDQLFGQHQNMNPASVLDGLEITQFHIGKTQPFNDFAPIDFDLGMDLLPEFDIADGPISQLTELEYRDQESFDLDKLEESTASSIASSSHTSSSLPEKRRASESMISNPNSLEDFKNRKKFNSKATEPTKTKKDFSTQYAITSAKKLELEKEKMKDERSFQKEELLFQKMKMNGQFKSDQDWVKVDND
ncbi:hypothetical protein HK096_001424, partial [Nowakowskiella sp. JEL0078]